MDKYLRKECSDLNKVASDTDDDKDVVDDVSTVEIGTVEALTMLERLVKYLKYLSKEERNSLVAIKDKLDKIRVLDKTQSYINDCFMLE